jgi:predicted nucleotidyltransferase
MARPPTRFNDLNLLLREFVLEVRTRLGANFLGAYLGGSFAPGSADEHSDVDFLVVTHQPVSQAEKQRLRTSIADCLARHPWRSTLTGHTRRLLSSAPTGPSLRAAVGRQRIREDGTLDALQHRRAPLDVARARRRPRRSASPLHHRADQRHQLRTEARKMAAEYLAWLEADWNQLHSPWPQPYIVTTFCRILVTVATDGVAMKAAALN